MDMDLVFIRTKQGYAYTFYVAVETKTNTDVSNLLRTYLYSHMVYALAT